MAIQYMKMMDNDNYGKGDSKQDWKRCSVKTEVLRLIQVARPCLGLVEVGSYLEFSVNPKLGSSIWAGNVKDTRAVFDC